jgi:hypothetical protein
MTRSTERPAVTTPSITDLGEASALRNQLTDAGPIRTTAVVAPEEDSRAVAGPDSTLRLHAPRDVSADLEYVHARRVRADRTLHPLASVPHQHP